MEYISKTDAIHVARYAAKTGKDVAGYIENLPAADVAPVVHGEWTQHYVGQENVPWGSDCSVCGEWLVIDRLVMQEKYHYCPNCGAKMDGGDHDAVP